MRYSVIIPTYNNASTVQRVLGAVRAEVGAADDVQVIVVDSSDDGSTEQLRATCPSIQLLHPPHRLLPGPARNLGAAQATGDVLVFLDGDCRPAPGWLSALRKASGGLEDGIVSGAVDPDEPCDLSQFMEYVIWKLAATSTVPRGPYGFVITDNMMIRRADFLRTGGFQESDSANDAQMDVARRAAHLAVTFEPNARVSHIHRSGWRFHFAKLYRIGVETLPLMVELRGYRTGRLTLWLLPFVFLVRWLRITGRVIRYRPRWVGRYFLLQPMLWVGLLVYQAGLWRGLFRLLREDTTVKGKAGTSEGRVGRRELWNRESSKYVGRAMAPAEFPLPVACLPRSGDWVLDAGCGAGNHLGMYRLITSTVFGLDLSDAMSRAAARHAVTVQGDVQLLPFRGAAFDYVSSYVVISHVPDSRAALAELARVTKMGGRLLLVVPNRWSFITPMRALLVRLGKYTLGSCRHYAVDTLRVEGRAHNLRVIYAAAVEKTPTAPSKLRTVPAWLGYVLDETVRRVYTRWGGDLAVLFEKHGAG